MGALLPLKSAQDHPRTKKKCRFFIRNIYFSLEKCRFEVHRGVLHYVLRQTVVILTKSVECYLEMCVKQRERRAARCMGSVPVAHSLASEARRPPPTCRASSRQERRRRPYQQPFPGRSIERVMRALATPSNKPPGASYIAQGPQKQSESIKNICVFNNKKITCFERSPPVPKNTKTC